MLNTIEYLFLREEDVEVVCEEDVAGRDRFFEVVGKPLGAAYGNGSPMTSVAHESTLQCALSFRVVGECPATTRHMEASQRRCFKAASNGRWALLAHILAEFPQLATAKDDTGANLAEFSCPAFHESNNAVAHTDT